MPKAHAQVLDNNFNCGVLFDITFKICIFEMY